MHSEELPLGQTVRAPFIIFRRDHFLRSGFFFDRRSELAERPLGVRWHSYPVPAVRREQLLEERNECTQLHKLISLLVGEILRHDCRLWVQGAC